MVIGKIFPVGILIIASLVFTPAQTKAGPITDYLNSFFGGRSDKHYREVGTQPHEHNRYGGRDRPYSPAQGNSVPIDGGLVLLLAAGLGLGIKMIYDSKGKSASGIA